MSLNRPALRTLLDITKNVEHHVSSLAKPNVPNYRVSATATGSFLFISCVSAMSDCGSATTYLSILFSLLHAGMFLNQNRDSTYEFASKSINTIGTGIVDTVTAIKQDEWVNSKYNSISKNINSLFGSTQAKATAEVNVTNNQIGNETDESESNTMKKTQ